MHRNVGPAAGVRLIAGRSSGRPTHHHSSGKPPRRVAQSGVDDPVDRGLLPGALARLKRLIQPTRDLQTMRTAYATIRGFEIMRMIRRSHPMLREPGVVGEVRFVNKLFGLTP